MIFNAPDLPGRFVKLENGHEYLWFSGTDYLGMAHNTLYKDSLKMYLERFGTHFGSSRNNSLQIQIYNQAEQMLSKTAGSANTLLVSSGLWAGQLIHKELSNIIKTSESEDVQYHYAPGVHPAIWGDHYVSESCGWAEWAKKTVEMVRASPEKTHIICTDSVRSPWVEAFDFSIFNDLPYTEKLWMIVDDSHGLGVTGTTGFGTLEIVGRITQANVIVVSSLNKAMGIPAGAIFCSNDVYRILRTSPWFAGASPPAPAYVASLVGLLLSGEFQKSLKQLRQNISHFQSIINPAVFQSVADYPVFCSSDAALFSFLERHGILASCFAYPRPTDAAVCRVVISSLHQQKDLDMLAEVCNSFIALPSRL